MQAGVGWWSMAQVQRLAAGGESAVLGLLGGAP
eukprot:COSAG01_NODE_1310_length_10786_cov_26.664265_2_plen_33_part_00